jgi:DNA-binding SARP family transcriptional activator/tetratricopeptide (TPR) repeat protein
VHALAGMKNAMELGTEFLVLGPIEARINGRLVDVGHPRQRCVLAILLVEANRAVPAHRLIERVWGDDPPPSARNVLSGYLTRLRSAFADALPNGDGPMLVRASGSYAISVDETAVDMHRFRRLVADARAGFGASDRARRGLDQALSLWRGSPFAGVSSQWLDTVRDGLENERVAALIDRNELALELGQHAELLQDLYDQSVAWPMNEILARQLMIALYRSGRPADALIQFEQIRRRLAEELGADPGPELRRAHEQVLRHDPVLAAHNPHRLRLRRLPPAQLPHAVSDFTGRSGELDVLQQFADQTRSSAGRHSAMVISAIDGTAGVGKTALAVHFAHRVAHKFPDGQLYVNLLGFDRHDPPAPPGEVLSRFLRGLGVDPRQVPVDLESRAGMYRSLLSGRRMLVLLDNAATADQVRPLLPGSNACLVLVTSRSRLNGLVAGDGARLLTLNVFTPPEALALLARTVGSDRVAREQEAATEIVRLCGRLPLALRICAELLVSRPQLTFAVLARRLAAENDRLDVLATGEEGSAVRAVLSWSYRNLEPDTASVFRLLGVHPGTETCIAAVSALADMEPATARRHLSVLLSANMLEEIAADRYRLHDLLRIYAAERSAETDSAGIRDAAVRRVLDWYLHTADAAGVMLDPNRPRIRLASPIPGSRPLIFASQEEALQWCEEERPNLVAATRLAATTGDHVTAWQLPAALIDYFYLRKPWSDWITTHEIGLASARRSGDALGEAGMLTSLGLAYYDVHRFADAIDCLERVLPTWRAIGFTAAEALTLDPLGAAYRDIGRPDQAVVRLDQALGLWRQLGDRWGEGVTLHNLGDTYRSLGRFDQAITYLREALTTRREIRDGRGIAWTLHDLGVACFDLGRFDDALGYLHEALAMRREVGDRQGEARTLRRLGSVYHALSRGEAAHTCRREALAIFEELGDPRASAVLAELDAP